MMRSISSQLQYEIRIGTTLGSPFQGPSTAERPPGETRDIDPIADVVTESLQQILMMKKRKPFSVSRATEMRIQDILASWDKGDVTGLVSAAEYELLLAEIRQRVAIDAKYSMALARLDDLNFQLQYTEYSSSEKEELDRCSRLWVGAYGDAFDAEPYTLPQIEENALSFFETQDWQDIWERLKQEPAFRWDARRSQKDSADESPLVNLVQVLAQLNDTWPYIIIAAIQAYVNRIAAKQSHLANRAAPNDVLLVASTLLSDLPDLKRVRASWGEAVPAVRDAIFVFIARCFTPFQWEEQAQRCWVFEWRGFGFAYGYY
ncbi:hypothetical protein V8C44DRAFT_133344 [Trichoderma aethiopicum]